MGLSRRFSRLLLFCIIPLVQAYTVFETTCTAPTTLSNFVSSPNTRGTLDILWSSLFTILACTWTLQHPNVPEQRDGRDPGLLGDLKWRLKGFYRASLRMLCTVIAPELIIGVACHDFVVAKYERKRFQKYAAEDDVEWTLAHSYYANMGGFVIRSKPLGEKDYHDPYHLTAAGIYELRENNYIPKLPDIPMEEIADKSKGDGLVKAIAVGQILWTILQVIVRAARRLPVSPLEIAVVGFAVCAVIIYGLHWNKPQRVYATKTILEIDGEIAPEMLKSLEGTFDGENVLANVFHLPKQPSLPGSPISINSTNDDASDGGVASFCGSLIGAAVFGGVHVIAWDFAFPTRVERIFWRCASVYTTAFPVAIVLIMTLADTLDDIIPWFERVWKGCVILLNSLYVAARLVILVEIFRTLCFLPPGSYVSTWTSNIPHIV